MPLDSRNSEGLTKAYTVGLETPGLDAAIIAMTDKAFGPGRYVKTAERLREGLTPYETMSYVACKDGQLIGSVRLWPVVVSNEAGVSETIAFLGPIVVDDTYRSLGIGRHLIKLSLEAAAREGLRAVLLVGDAAYFQPLGFERADMTLPGPVDQRRVLIHYTTPGDCLSGAVSRADESAS